MDSSLFSSENSGVTICSDRKLFYLECQNDVVLLNMSPNRLHIFVYDPDNSVVMFWMYFAPSIYEMPLQDCVSLKLHLVLTVENLVGVDRLTYLGSCISCSGHIGWIVCAYVGGSVEILRFYALSARA